MSWFLQILQDPVAASMNMQLEVCDWHRQNEHLTTVFLSLKSISPSALHTSPHQTYLSSFMLAVKF